MPPAPPKAPSRRLPAEPWWSLPVAVHEAADGLHVRVAWRRLGLQLLGLAVAGWLALAAAVFLWVKYWRGFDDARFGDILLPQRWDDYRVARGNFYIAQAQREFAARQWSEAIHHLRVGVAAAPANLEGRLALAQVFIAIGRIELAQRTLVEGLPYAHGAIDYLKTLFNFLLQYQQDDEVRRIAAELLPDRPVLDERHQLVALAAATANLYRGNYDAAESLVEEYGLLHTAAMDGRLVFARVQWERGHRALALELLKAYTQQFPAEEQFYGQLASYHRELGQEAAVEKFALLRALANPRSALARIDLLRAYRRNHHNEQFRQDVNALLRDFADDQSALLALANLGTEEGDPALALRVYRHLQDHRLETDAAGLMVVEAYIAARDYRAALGFIAEIGRTRPEWTQKFLGVISGLQAVASYGLDQREEADLYLGHFLKQPDLRAEHLVAIANRLVDIGVRQEARRVLAQAVAIDPRNQAALTKLIELDLQRAPTAELTTNLQRLLAMRRPSTETLRAARARLASDRFLFVTGRDKLLAAIQSAIERAPVPVGKT